MLEVQHLHKNNHNYFRNNHQNAQLCLRHMLCNSFSTETEAWFSKPVSEFFVPLGARTIFPIVFIYNLILPPLDVMFFFSISINNVSFSVACYEWVSLTARVKRKADPLISPALFRSMRLSWRAASCKLFPLSCSSCSCCKVALLV